MKNSLRTALILLTPLLCIPVAFAASAVSEVWTEHCQRCHGANGTGNTKVGKKLRVKDYSSAKVQAEMTDDDILRVIREGAFDENKKERMPAYKEKLGEKEIMDLLIQVRAFKQ